MNYKTLSKQTQFGSYGVMIEVLPRLFPMPKLLKNWCNTSLRQTFPGRLNDFWHLTRGRKLVVQMGNIRRSGTAITSTVSNANARLDGKTMLR